MSDHHENFNRLLYTIIIAQFGVIIILLSALSNEYLSNAYMQTWINKNAPGLGILLHGELDTTFVGAAIGLTFLFIRRRRDAADNQSAKRLPEHLQTRIEENLTRQ